MEFRSAKLRAVPKADESGVSATLRAFALLECIAASQDSPSLEELTRASGLPKPTVHRILHLLMSGGLVEREVHDKRYAFGFRMAALSRGVQLHSPRRTERHAILTRLVNAIGETCNYTMLDGDEIVYLDRVETSANVRLHMKTGSRVPAHCTASGKLLLSDLSPAHVRRLLGSGPLRRHTERTIVDVDALLRELAKIGSTRVGTDVSEYLEGSVCVAVPVCDAHGRMCAAVAAHGPAPRMSLKKGYTFLPAMREAAAAIAATLAPTDARCRAQSKPGGPPRTPRIAA
jgi:DNA-binding IclR family transcriptional regulator